MVKWQVLLLCLLLPVSTWAQVVNYAPGKQVKASSIQTGQYNPAPVTDGKMEVGPGKMWVSGRISSGSPQWLAIDLGEERMINTSKIYSSGYGEHIEGALRYYAPKRGYLEGSNFAAAWLRPDRDTYWTRIADFEYPNIARAELTTTFSPVSYRYVRLVVTRAGCQTPTCRSPSGSCAMILQAYLQLSTTASGNDLPC